MQRERRSHGCNTPVPRVKFPSANGFSPRKIGYSRRRWSIVPIDRKAGFRTQASSPPRLTDRKENYGYCQESCQEIRGQEVRREEDCCQEARCEEERGEEARREEVCCEEARREEDC